VAYLARAKSPTFIGSIEQGLKGVFGRYTRLSDGGLAAITKCKHNGDPTTTSPLGREDAHYRTAGPA
jgi:hypothetical protein